MFRESHLELVRTKGTTLARILMGLLFVVTGIWIALSPATVSVYFTTLGIPMANIVVWIVVAIKVLAGGAIILGKRTTEAAAVLIIFTLIATILAHISPETDATFPTGMLKNLAIVGGLLYLMAYGPHGMDVKGQEPE